MRTIHWVTALQFAGLVALWVLKTTKIQGFPLGILFPLLIALLVPFRMSLVRFFDENELQILDSQESEEVIEQQNLHP